VDLAGTWAVSFPLLIVDRETVKLQRDLRQIYNELRLGGLLTAYAYFLGNRAITDTYTRLLQLLQTYFSRHDLPLPPETKELQNAKTNAQNKWRQLVDDFVTSSSAVSVSYWFTHRGLLTRTNLIAQDFVYDQTNVVMVDVAYQTQAYALHWISEDDERVCPVCQRYAEGGNHGYYLLNWYMPAAFPPVHPNCRCRIEILYQN